MKYKPFEPLMNQADYSYRQLFDCTQPVTTAVEENLAHRRELLVQITCCPKGSWGDVLSVSPAVPNGGAIE